MREGELAGYGPSFRKRYSEERKIVLPEHDSNLIIIPALLAEQANLREFRRTGAIPAAERAPDRVVSSFFDPIDESVLRFFDRGLTDSMRSRASLPGLAQGRGSAQDAKRPVIAHSNRAFATGICD